MAVYFYDKIEDSLLKFAVILAKYKGKYIFCKHKEWDTLEIPGGHREKSEAIDETARRELREETGAIHFDMKPICVYSVTEKNLKGNETFGMFYYAEIKLLNPVLHNEIEKIVITDALPDNWTYPNIQPDLIGEAKRRGFL